MLGGTVKSFTVNIIELRQINGTGLASGDHDSYSTGGMYVIIEVYCNAVDGPQGSVVGVGAGLCSRRYAYHLLVATAASVAVSTIGCRRPVSDDWYTTTAKHAPSENGAVIAGPSRDRQKTVP